ncbi:MAG: prepilin-type N-terminal cleavage/methylation domain-containing protein [Candidatus Rokubacteria bacterium]|nr:prepilin-type N-terminal cleavage/methylation domain-containing protein [Candidatus Rokubacteria bacterium]
MTGSQRGFTLIEVIVALSILSVAVVASIQGFAQGLRLLKLSGEHQRATLFADQKLREVVVPKEGREEEEDRDAGFTWERVTTAVETPELVTDGAAESPWKVWQIAVRVRWAERRQVEIATLRTVSSTPDETTETGTTDAGSTTPQTSTGRRGAPSRPSVGPAAPPTSPRSLSTPRSRERTR